MTSSSFSDIQKYAIEAYGTTLAQLKILMDNKTHIGILK